MPSLPRIRRSRPRGGLPAIAPAPVVHELTASGLTWVNVVSPDVETATELAARFGWHPLDVEDIVSKRQRPKVDDYDEDGYLFAVLHFPFYDNPVQRLDAAELDIFVGHDYIVTIPNRELRPVTRLFARCEKDDVFREQLFAGLRPAPLRDPRRPLRLLLPDPRQDRPQARRIEDEMFEGRSQEVVRDISNVKLEIISYRKIIKPERSTLRVLERRVEGFLPEELELYFDDIVDAAERIWDLLDNYKEVVDGARDDERVGALPPPERRPPHPHRVQRHPAPADAHRRHLRHERRFPGEGTHEAFWMIVGAHARHLRGDDRLLPLEALALTARATSRATEAGPPPHRGPASSCRRSLEEDSESRLGRAAASREARRVVKVDLDVGGENERRSDVVPGADELFEAPSQDRFCLRLVDQFELGRSHFAASLFVYDYRVTVQRHRPRAAPT